MDGLQNRLAQGLAALGVTSSEEINRRLLAFIDLLHKWNRVYNLTAIRDKQLMLSHHLLDSLAVAPWVTGDHILDVGSGAGLPGVPLALISPERQFVLIDSNAKKTRFLQQAKAELGISNLNIETVRVEQFQALTTFDTVLSRAFSSLSQFVLSAGRHCKPNGHLIAMKGEYPQEELREIPLGYSVKAVVALTVPYLDAQRHIVEIVRQ